MSRPSDPRQIAPPRDDARDLGVDVDLRHAEHLLRRVGDPDVRSRLHRTLVLWDLGYTREALSQFRVVAESTLGRLLNALAEGEDLRDAVDVAAIDTQRARLARGQISKVVEWLYGEAEVLPARLALHLHTLLGWGNYASHHQRAGHHARGSDLAVLLSVAIDVEAWCAQRLGARSIFDAEDDAWRAQELERAGVALGLEPEVARRFVAAAGVGSRAETDRLIAPHLALELFFAPPASAKTLSRAAPYRGLESFDPEDAAQFFGRDETIERLQKNVQKEPLSVLCGVSGAGKTSLLRAGLVPKLLEEGSGVLWLSDYAAPALRAAMQVIGAWPADRLLIVIFDQAEHAMLPETPEALRRGLLELLLRAERWRYGIRMIVSLREDFFGQLLREADAVDKEGAAPLHDPRAFVSVGRLTHEATRQAIVRPLEGEEIAFSDALVGDLVAQLAGDAGAPPAQLQLVCTRLYEHALARAVTLIDRAFYRALGGTEKILETYLDETLASARYEGERELARTLLKAMVGGATRRWVDLGELWHATRPVGMSIDAVQLAGLLHRLADDRLVVSHAAEPGGAVDYSLVHDQLALPIRDWRSAAEIERQQAQELLDRVCAHFDDPAQRELLGGRQLKLVERHFATLRQRASATAVLVASRRARRLRWATSLTLAGAALFGLLFGAFQLRRAVDERDRALTVADEGVLLQARLALRRDPSSAVAWLRKLSSQAGGVGVLTVLGEARRRGVARVLAGHSAPVTAVAFSPDGATVLSASHDHTLRRWDVQGARPRGPPLRGHRAAIACMAISADGSIVASGDLHDEIRLWDRASGRSLAVPLRGHENWVYGLAFSPKAPLLASASLDGSIRLWHLQRRASGDVKVQRVAVLRGHRKGVTAVAFSPDGKLLASASRDHSLRLWDVASHSPHGAPLEGHSRAVLAVAFSPDGKLLASAGLDATVRFWDPGTSLPRGEVLRHHENAVIALAFSPDGKLLASGGEDKEVVLWDVAKRRLRGEPLRGHLEFVRALAFSPDGKLLASASQDHTVRLWNLAARAGASYRLRGHRQWVHALAFSPDGKVLASGARDGSIRLWDRFRRRPLGRLLGHEDAVASLAFSPDGRSLVSASHDHTLRLWPVARALAFGEPLREPLTSRVLFRDKEAIYAVAFSGDGRLLATGGIGEIRLWRRASTSTARSTATSSGSTSSGSTSSGSTSSGSTSSGSTSSGSTSSGSTSSGSTSSGSTSHGSTSHGSTSPAYELVGEPLVGHDDAVASLAFGPAGTPGEGLLASAGFDGLLQLWDVHQAAAVGPPVARDAGRLYQVAFSPDGKLIVAAGSRGTIQRYDVTTRLPVGSALRGHQHAIYGLAFSPDGATLASVGADATLRLWQVATGAPRGLPLRGHTATIYAVAYAPDGALLATGSADRTIWLWQTRPVTPGQLRIRIDALTNLRVDTN